MRKKLNLTQHKACERQVAEGSYEPSDKAAVQAALTFSADEVRWPQAFHKKVVDLVAICRQHEAQDVILGGLPALMGPLQRELNRWGVNVWFSFSDRESEDQPLPCGGSKKVSVFRHQFFFLAPDTEESQGADWESFDEYYFDEGPQAWEEDADSCVEITREMRWEYGSRY